MTFTAYYTLHSMHSSYCYLLSLTWYSQFSTHPTKCYIPWNVNIPNQKCTKSKAAISGEGGYLKNIRKCGDRVFWIPWVSRAAEILKVTRNQQNIKKNYWQIFQPNSKNFLLNLTVPKKSTHNFENLLVSCRIFFNLKE